MRLYLINPRNSIVSVTNVKGNRWNQYRIWKPLGLLVVAGLTPPEWEITVIDENLGIPDYMAMPRPDLVGITAFTSQAERAYEVAGVFQGRDAHVRQGDLKRIYTGMNQEMDKVPVARHDLLSTGYHFGSIQTTRGCPLSCNFCSVSAFNGRRYRHRSIEKVITEFKRIREEYVLIVDDNLIGTRKDHIARAKEMFRAMIKADLRKKWICQVTINIADDEELLSLAAKAGCLGVFIGFESVTVEGLIEVHKKFNIQKNRDFKASVERIRGHGIMVAGSFIMGLDVDREGIGQQIADAANRYNVDILNLLFLTPFPGTRLWEKMESKGRIAANSFPEDWKYYTLTFPVAKYNHLSWAEMLSEMSTCYRDYYSPLRILRRVIDVFRRSPNPISALILIVASISYKRNHRTNFEKFQKFNLSMDAFQSKKGKI
jgi:radical SAM superfamily enzyme YgiQ (UPF0313 family)